MPGQGPAEPLVTLPPPTNSATRQAVPRTVLAVNAANPHPVVIRVTRNTARAAEIAT